MAFAGGSLFQFFKNAFPLPLRLSCFWTKVSWHSCLHSSVWICLRFYPYHLFSAVWQWCALVWFNVDLLCLELIKTLGTYGSIISIKSRNFGPLLFQIFSASFQSYYQGFNFTNIIQIDIFQKLLLLCSNIYYTFFGLYFIINSICFVFKFLIFFLCIYSNYFHPDYFSFQISDIVFFTSRSIFYVFFLTFAVSLLIILMFSRIIMNI